MLFVSEVCARVCMRARPVEWTKVYFFPRLVVVCVSTSYFKWVQTSGSESNYNPMAPLNPQPPKGPKVETDFTKTRQRFVICSDAGALTLLCSLHLILCSRSVPSMFGSNLLYVY